LKTILFPLTKPPLRKTYLKLLALGIGLGLGIGAIAGSFMWAQHYLIDLLWESLPHRLGISGSLYFVLIPVIGGIAVGLGRKHLGDHPQPIRTIIEKARAGEKLPGVHSAPIGYLLSLISLGFGASLGPEAALAGITVGFGAKAKDVMAQTAHNFRLDEVQTPWRQLPGVMALLAGFLSFVVVAKPMFNLRYHYLPYTFSFSLPDMLFAVLLGAAGLVSGLFFVKSEPLFRWLLRPIEKRFVILGMLGGVTLGLLGLISPFILFSGQRTLGDLFVQHAGLNGGLLILIGVLKLLATRINIATGWKGGQIFPMMFATAAIGVGVSQLFPAIHPMIAVAAIMTAAITVELESMIAGLVIVAFFLPLNLALTMFIAALVAALGTGKHPFKMAAMRRTANQSDAS